MKTIHAIAHVAIQVDDDVPDEQARQDLQDALADGAVDGLLALDEQASIEFLGFGDGIQIGVVVEEGLVSEVRSNVPIAEYLHADLDVFEDCFGDVEKPCDPQTEGGKDGRKEEHDRIRAAYAAIQQLPEVTA